MNPAIQSCNPATRQSCNLLVRALRLYLRSGARGSTRATFLLARHVKALQTVPIAVNASRVYVDLRDGLSHRLLVGSPWPAVPWEGDEQAAMRQLVRSGDLVLDVGAHIGLHTVVFCELVGSAGQVHAFEPNPAKTRTLLATLAAWPNARLHAFALGDAPRHAAFFVPEDESMASLADWTGGRAGRVRTASCEVRRLDDLIDAEKMGQPDFVKCDVEGHELGVFRGARRMLDRRDAPVIFYEANAASAQAFGASLGTATEFLHALEHPRYRFFHVRSGGALEPVEASELRGHHVNLVAIPAARAERVPGALAP